MFRFQDSKTLKLAYFTSYQLLFLPFFWNSPLTSIETGIPVIVPIMTAVAVFISENIERAAIDREDLSI